jgi:hypothetical protein
LIEIRGEIAMPRGYVGHGRSRLIRDTPLIEIRGEIVFTRGQVGQRYPLRVRETPGFKANGNGLAAINTLDNALV